LHLDVKQTARTDGMVLRSYDRNKRSNAARLAQTSPWDKPEESDDQDTK